MSPTPWDAVRLVGRSYFVHRFHTSGGGASATNDAWLEGLPLSQRPSERFSEGHATLRFGGLEIPLSQRVAEVHGGSPWIAFSDGRTVEVGGINNGSLELGFDPWFAMGAGLLGLAAPFDDSGNAPKRKHTPWVDRFAREFAASLVSLGADIRPRLPWPGNAPFAVCLTHDVDRIQKTFQYVSHLGRTKGLRGAAKSRRRGGRPYWGFDAVRDIERGEGVRSTFFMLHEGPEAKQGIRNRILAWGLADFENPELASTVISLAREGWEIGLHASLASTASQDRISLEKRKLEAIVGGKVHGVRQHHLRLLLPDRWDEFAGAGLAYDSSFGFRHTWGFRGGTAFPYFLAGSKNILPLREVPLHIMDSALARSHDAWAECTQALDAVQSVGGVLTVLFHQRFFDSRNYPGYADLFERLIAEAKRRQAWIGPAGEVLRAWSR